VQKKGSSMWQIVAHVRFRLRCRSAQYLSS